MAAHQKTSQKNQEDAEHKHRLRQNQSEPSEQLHAFDLGILPLAETPFQPRMDEHAELLAATHADEARSNLVLQLQQTYGNTYVQSLLNSMTIQAKLTVNAPNDILEQEADRVADVVAKSATPRVQRQEEEEELQAQRQEEEEEVQMRSLLQRQVEPEEEILAKPLIQRQAEPEEEEEEELQAKSLLQHQDVDKEQEETHMQSDDDQTVDFLEEPQVSKTNGGLSVIQREWAPEDVNEALKIGAAGVRAELKRGDYKIFKFEDLRIKKRVDLEEKEGSLHGYHCRACRMIGIKAGETPQAAAATIVHESQHAQQYEEREANAREDWDILKREYEAHIREEQFRKAHNESPKIAEFRDKDNNIDVKAIKNWVESNYGKRSVRRYYPSGHPKDGQLISVADLRHIHNLATGQSEVKIW